MHVSLLFIVLLGVCYLGFSQTPLYKSVDANRSTVFFENTITENDSTNVALYDYFYNGGGVAVGDVNNDGLSDLFFTGNQVQDQLYLNKGDFVFEAVTLPDQSADKSWSTGVCMFDVNQDGLLDIYVCKSGWFENTDQLKNKLYVNQGNGKFVEDAEGYGLAIATHSVQAAPLDFDLDGDLDLYIAGHPANFQHRSNFAETLRAIDAGLVEGDVLLENVNGKYVDVTKKAGIFEYGYTLGLAISDVNNDGYPDIAIGNDFDEPDHLFINQKDGTFKDDALNRFKHTSNYSMGNDFGDVNNDGLLDYISVDMAFETHERSKMNMASMDPTKFNARVKLGWNEQYMHNMLQLNSGLPYYQEVSYFSGVAKTDWSWGPLFMDIDADGYQDLFISNGYKRDTKNNDIQHLINQELEKKNQLTPLEAIQLIPAVKVANFFYKNEHDLTFSDQRKNWGVNEKLNTNGAAYADLDNDGDLDLILNNVDTLASIYENTLNASHHWLTVDYSGVENTCLVGAKFSLQTKNTLQTREAYFVRGYQSAVEQKIHFYWTESDEVEQLTVQLTNGITHQIPLKKKDYTLKLNKLKFKKLPILEKVASNSTYFNEVAAQKGLVLNHYENEHSDFEKETLLPHELSSLGPALAVADLNNDGLEDMIMGSAVGRIPAVIIQKPDGRFGKMTVASFFNHQMSEDGGIVPFDVNGDGNKDLFISSGGYQYPKNDSNYINRLYIGNGTGNFGYVKNALPVEFNNSGKVIPCDFEGDGDLDFFICGSADPQNYPNSGQSALYINTNGFYKNKIRELAPELVYAGMLRDGVFSDFDGDGDKDLIVVGEWTDIRLFEYKNGRLFATPNEIGLTGWWNTIKAVDIDGDGDEDYLVGNVGLNTKYRSDGSKKLSVYANDFDDNGTRDIVLAMEGTGKALPVRGKECSTGQMPFIEQKFPTFISFATASLTDIYSTEKLDQALQYKMTESRSGILYNQGNRNFDFVPFSNQGQFSTINGFEVLDINNDNRLDILAIGNRFETEVETTKNDASNGNCYLQQEDGTFTFVPAKSSGFYVPNNARTIAKIKLGKEERVGIVVTNNNGGIQLFQLR